MNEQIEVVKLEDGIEYAVLAEITENNDTYVYLTNVNDEKDFCIRKIKEEPTGKMLVGLKDSDEFNQALLYFTKKMQSELDPS